MKKFSPPYGGLRPGFTFVELLVVVSIIALLTTIGIANYANVGKKARDGKRKSDLEQIRAAVEIYRSDQDTYPPNNAIVCGGTLSASGNTYMDPIPCDPKSPGQNYVYNRPTTVTYTLGATMEIDTSGGTCGSGTAYCVKQP